MLAYHFCHVSCHFITASVCVPVCTHFEAPLFYPPASDVSVAEAYSRWYKSICHFHVICHCLGLRARGHAFRDTYHRLGLRARVHVLRGTSFALFLPLPRFACPCARILRHLIFFAFCLCLGLRARGHALRSIAFSLHLSLPRFACPCARTSRHLIFIAFCHFSRFACPCARTSRHLIP